MIILQQYTNFSQNNNKYNIYRLHLHYDTDTSTSPVRPVYASSTIPLRHVYDLSTIPLRPDYATPTARLSLFYDPCS